MKLTLPTTIILLLSGGLLPLPAEDPAPALTKLDARAKAKEVFSAYLVAIGGLEAHEKLTHRKSEGSVNFPAATAIPFKFSKLQMTPDLVLVEYLLSGTLTHSEGHDGRRGWTWNPAEGSRRMSGTELASKQRDFAFHPYLDLPEQFDTLLHVGTRDVGGKRYEVLRGIIDKDEEHFYFNARTHLLHIVETPDYTLKLDDYREVDDVKLAFSTDLEEPGGERVLSIQLKSISHKANASDIDFRMPKD